MSTLVLRAMYERGDLTILHEPGGCAFNYLCGYPEELLSSMWRDDAIKTLPEVGAHILKFATKKPVFVKEMRAATEALFQSSPELRSYPYLHPIFLIRHPYDMLMSNYHMRKNLAMVVSPQNLWDRLSYHNMYDLYESLFATGAHAPIVIIAEELCTNPEQIMSRFCHLVSIPFLADKLAWLPLPQNFDAHEEWHANGKDHEIQYWHAEALQSTGFHAPRRYTAASGAEHLFEEIEDPELRKLYCELYYANLPFYEKFLQIFKDQFFSNV